MFTNAGLAETLDDRPEVRHALLLGGTSGVFVICEFGGKSGLLEMPEFGLTDSLESHSEIRLGKP